MSKLIKNKKLLIAIALASILIISILIIILASPNTYSGPFKVKKINNEIMITGLKDKYNDSTELIIPDQIMGIPVTSLGSKAFSDCNRLESITLPDSLISINYLSFYHCSSLKSITIPENVRYIGHMAFSGCTSMLDVSFGDNSHLTTMEYSLFENCSSLESIEIPDGVTIIDSHLFQNCYNLKDITFGDNSQLTSIGYSSFSYCINLSTIVIPSGVINIETQAFLNCTSLENITFMDNSVLDSINESFSGCSSLQSIEIPGSVIYIGDKTFFNCSNLTTVTFGNNSKLNKIGDSSFSGCLKLETLSIPNSVRRIGQMAFQNCIKLQNITIPFRLTEIKQYTFLNCTSLENITFETNSLLNIIGDYAFSGCQKLRTLTIPDSVKSIGREAFLNCISLEIIDLRSNSQITNISNVFSGCNSLKNILFSNNSIFTDIDPEVFSDCESLESIYIPNSVTNIQKGAFQNCKSLINIEVSENNSVFKSIDGNLYSIDGSILYCYCAGKPATQFIAPNALDTIAVYAFSNSLITDIDFNNVIEIEEYAFYNCSRISTIYLNEKIESIGNYVFLDCININDIFFYNEYPRFFGTIGLDENTVNYHIPHDSLGLYHSFLHNFGVTDDKISYISSIISFDSLGGSDVVEKTQTYLAPLQNMPVPTKEGYEFIGWREHTGSDARLFINDHIWLTYKPKTLYATWTPVPYSITYHLEEGTHNSVSNPSYYYISEQHDLFPSSPIDYYYFTGWYDSQENGNLIAQIVPGTTGNMDLYARYAPTNYQIAYILPYGVTNTQVITLMMNLIFLQLLTW